MRGVSGSRDPAQAPVFAPGRLAGLELRNRIIKSATYEGMTPGGVPAPALIEHHRRIAEGGVAMTTVAYCSVSPNGRTFGEQLVMGEPALPALRELTDAVHREGAAASIQLGHCGFFTRNAERNGARPLGPSRAFNSYGLMSGIPFARAMTEADIGEVVEAFGRASGLAREAGFDAVELHLGHGYLLSQFLSPATNRRRDRYGGSLENRLRFPTQVVRRVRAALGTSFPILAKTNLSDGFRGGLQVEEAVGVARRLEEECIDAIVLSGGFTSRTPLYLLRGGRPLREMIEVEKSPLQKIALRLFGPVVLKSYRFEEMFFLPQAREVRRAVGLPLVLLGGIVSLDNMDVAMGEGFDYVALGRALIADPSLVRDMREGKIRRTRCDACNVCMAEMDSGGVRCVLDGPRSSEGTHAEA
jgi:2,4-dienoyl-CoA reductase-like NADH-dependent reductase (Old Yellow Enzyme family)